MKTWNIWGGILLMLLMESGIGLAQDKFFSRKGQIVFFSHTPIEDIEAVNDDVSSVLDAATGKLEFAALMKAFQFKKALMQEHFNENYVESAKYPKAVFKGQILNWQQVDLSQNGLITVKVKGDLTIKGVTQPLETEATLLLANGTITSGKTIFYLNPEDFNIEIPAVVRNNIADKIEVRVKVPYQLFTP